MQSNKRSNSGFSLIEVLVVVAIMGVLMGGTLITYYTVRSNNVKKSAGYIFLRRKLFLLPTAILRRRTAEEFTQKYILKTVFPFFTAKQKLTATQRNIHLPLKAQTS